MDLKITPFGQMVVRPKAVDLWHGCALMQPADLMHYFRRPSFGTIRDLDLDQLEVERARVGQQTNFDRLLLEIWTDGTIQPKVVLVEVALPNLDSTAFNVR